MRVAILANSAWYIANFRLTLMKALAAQGHDILAVSPDGADVRRIREAGFAHRVLPLSGKGMYFAREIGSILALRQLLSREAIDLALTYTPKGNLYTGLARRGIACRQIANISGLGSSFLRQDWVSALTGWLYRRVLPRVDWTFFQNASDRQHFVASGLVDIARSDLVPGSGVDLKWFSLPVEREDPSYDAGVVFLMVSRLIGDKGVREYVEAARRVKSVFPAARFQLLGAVGVDNPTAIQPKELQAWIASGCVEYLGFVEDVRGALASSTCVVLPSYREGMSRTLLEAAAMERPLIATDVPGCAETIDEGLNGFLCAPRDAASLERAMLRMIDVPPTQRESMGLHSRRKMEREFSEDVVVNKYLAAVASLSPRT